MSIKKKLAGLSAALAVSLTSLLGVQSVVAPDAQAAVCKTAPLTVDGVFGKQSVCALQRFLGMKTQDGVISGQRSALKKFRPALTSVASGSSGSATVRELQGVLLSWEGQYQDDGGPYFDGKIDGQIGERTVMGLQRFLGEFGWYCPSGCTYKGEIDGVFGKTTAKAFQEFLNSVW